MSSNLHTNGKTVTLIPVTVVGAGATIVGATIAGVPGMKFVSAIATFLYGAGGTAVKVYIQTSLDGGATWIDMISLTFTTSAGVKGGSVTLGSANPAAFTDGSLSDNTTFGGAFGDRVRAKAITTGTYTGATSIAVSVSVKG